MAKQQIHTSMLGRRVQLGYSPKQIQAWVAENPGKSCNVATLCGQYEEFGLAVGEIVNVYMEDGTVVYDVLVDTDLLVGLSAKYNFAEVLPVQVTP